MRYICVIIRFISLAFKRMKNYCCGFILPNITEFIVADGAGIARVERVTTSQEEGSEALKEIVYLIDT